jgi:membrane associated rhomboid family serine protease
MAMSSHADLFVVCKQCGSEVSPYITECPYCGHRLRRRAPKLPRQGAPLTATPPRAPSLGRLRKGEMPGIRAEAHPYVTIAIVALSVIAWVVVHFEPTYYAQLLVFGPLHGDWWRLISSQFIYINGFYEFATVLAVAIFGWLLERRHGPLVVAILFLGVGVLGGLATLAIYPVAIVGGANGAALALLLAWATPDLLALSRGREYEGDLLGAGVIGLTLLAMPIALTYSSWVAGLTGVVLGALAGLALARRV